MARFAVPLMALVRRLTHPQHVHALRPHFTSRVLPSQRPPVAFRPHRRVSTKSSLPPPETPPVELSDRELLMRLLRRPQRQWYWLGGVVVVGATLVAFGPELKLGVSKHTAEVATKSLQDETLQRNTRELASQIVQTVLNDPKVLDQASFFIQRLVVMDVTRDSLRALVVHTLNDPTTLANVTKLARALLTQLLEDANTRTIVVAFLRQTLQDPETRAALLKLLDEIMKDKTMQKNLAQLLAQTFTTEPVKASVANTIGESVHDVLSRTDIQNHAKQFVGTVVQDQTVQAQSGDAIWGTVMYAITPSWLSWIWEQSEEPAEPVGVVTVPVPPAEADALVEEATEAFSDAVEKRTESKDVAPEAETEAENESETVGPMPLVQPKPKNRFEMLRRFTMRLARATASDDEAASEETEQNR